MLMKTRPTWMLLAFKYPCSPLLMTTGLYTRGVLKDCKNIQQHGKWFEPRNISCLSCVIIQVRVVFRKTVVGDWCVDYLSSKSSSESSEESLSDDSIYAYMYGHGFGWSVKVEVIGHDWLKGCSDWPVVVLLLVFQSVYCMSKFDLFEVMYESCVRCRYSKLEHITLKRSPPIVDVTLLGIVWLFVFPEPICPQLL